MSISSHFLYAIAIYILLIFSLAVLPWETVRPRKSQIWPQIGDFSQWCNVYPSAENFKYDDTVSQL